MILFHLISSSRCYTGIMIQATASSSQQTNKKDKVSITAKEYLNTKSQKNNL